MTDTDRKKIKDEQEGEFLTTAGISSAHVATQDLHSRSRDFLKTGSENAATAVAESPEFTHKRKARHRSISLLTGTNVASDNTDYLVIKFYKRTSAGATQTLVGSWNTHGGAQGAITANVPAVIAAATGLVTNSDADIAAGSPQTYEILKQGAGKVLAALTVFTHDLEEI